MTLKKEKFKRYELDEGKRQDIVGIKLNSKERTNLEHLKAILQQEKDATAIKQLVNIGAEVILHSPQGVYLRTVLENIRKNKRLGIIEVEPKI